MMQTLRIAAARFPAVGPLVGALLAGLAGATPAAAAPFQLTLPTTWSSDDWPTVARVGGGFELAWQRYDALTGKTAIFMRRHTAAGRPVGAEQMIDMGGTSIGRPRLVRMQYGAVGLLWVDPSQGVVGRLVEVNSGAMSALTVFAESSSQFFSAARLLHGQILVSHMAIDRSDPSDPRERVALSERTASLDPIAETRFVTGSDNSPASVPSFDHTVVAKVGGGSLNLYRNRADRTLRVVPATPTAVMGRVATRVNATAMRASTDAELRAFRVQAVRLTDGRTVVVWTSPEAPAGSLQKLRLRFLDARGIPIGSEQLVDATPGVRQTLPRLVALPDSRFGVAWYHDAWEGAPRSHRIRWYGADGQPLGAAATLRSDDESGDLAGSQLLNMGDGRVLQVWRRTPPASLRSTLWGEFLTPP